MADPQSTLTRRSQLSKLAGQHFQGARDLYDTFGYPRHLLAEDYTAIYLRQDLAARIVDAFPDATWREIPEILADEKFQRDWQTLENEPVAPVPPAGPAGRSGPLRRAVAGSGWWRADAPARARQWL